MRNIVTGAIWALFALLAYCMIADGLQPLLALPTPGDMGFVPAFTLFSLLHGGRMLGARRVALFFLLSTIISYAAEEAGVRTGLIFGHYHYSDQLGLKLGHVPILVPLGWFMMIYPAWVVARAVLRGVDLHRPAGLVALALVAALAMTGWDMVMDPPMVRAGVWVWEDGGPYFGVPIHNYAGWVLNTFVIYLAFGLTARAITGAAPRYPFGGVFAVLPVVLYALFAAKYVSPNRMPPLALIGVFAMALPALLALLRLILPPSEENSAQA